MKAFLLVSLLVSSLAQAGSVVCAGTKLHYVKSTRDSGIPPKPGMKIGTEFLANEGELYRERDVVYLEDNQDGWELTIKFEGEKVLYEKTSKTGTVRVTRASMVVFDNKLQIDGPKFQDSVTCTEEMKFVP